MDVAGFLAPEQMSVASYNATAICHSHATHPKAWSYATDVWSAAVTLLHVATGSMPIGAHCSINWLDHAVMGNDLWSTQDKVLWEASAKARSESDTWVASTVRDMGGVVDEELVKAGESCLCRIASCFSCRCRG